MGGGTSGRWPAEIRPKVPEKLTLLDTINSEVKHAEGSISVDTGAGEGGAPLGVPEDMELLTEKMRKCDCCGELSIPVGSRFMICRVCGWQDDPEQKANPYLKNRSNKMSLQEARRALAEGEQIH